MANLRCSQANCKKRLNDVKTMSLQDLEKYTNECCDCGDWIFKEEEFANKTYNAVSNQWASEFMNKLINF